MSPASGTPSITKVVPGATGKRERVAVNTAIAVWGLSACNNAEFPRAFTSMKPACRANFKLSRAEANGCSQVA